MEFYLTEEQIEQIQEQIDYEAYFSELENYLSSATAELNEEENHVSSNSEYTSSSE